MHVIRLRGPWRLRRVGDAGGDAAEEQVVKLPGPPPDFSGAREIVLTRSFHRPTGLADAAVWLVVEGGAAPLRAELNGELFAAASGRPLRLEVTSLLAPTNTIRVEIELVKPAAADPAGQWLLPGHLRDVRLEIEGG